MATKFLEPGGDATFDTSMFSNPSATTVVSDFVHSKHVRSLKFTNSGFPSVDTPTGTIADAGGRISFYIYITALPGVTATLLLARTAASQNNFSIRLTTAGVLQLWNGSNVAQIGTDGATLSIGTWYRISLAYTITSGSVNRFELFVDGVSSISVTNATITVTGTSLVRFGNIGGDTTMTTRMNDFYVDDSTALTDPGDIYVTAKRPNANGTTNGFTTQIGAGGSGYGSGHSPQVNERALSKTNGWSIVGAGSAITEEYSVEGVATGDMDITGKTIKDWLAWIYVDATVGETGTIIYGGNTSTFTLPASAATRLVTAVVGSTAYPAGGTDVGVITDTSVTTVNLYECGVLIAFIGPPVTPVVVPSKRKPTLLLMGVG